MSRSVEELLSLLDRVDAPDQWTDIVVRSDIASSHRSGGPTDVAFEAASREVATGNSRKRGDMDRTGWTRALGSVAAATVLVVAVIAFAARGDDAPDDESPATSPPSSTRSTTAETLPKPFDEDAALQVTNAYFDAFAAGELEALMATFVDDHPYHSDGSDVGQLLAWNLAQGTVLTPPECDTSELDVAAAIEVSCRFGNRDALVQAVDGPSVPIELTLTITSDGITAWSRTFGQPDFLFVGNPFDSWMVRTHPDILDHIAFGNWESVEEAEQNGILTAQYAREWAAYLEANGCLDGDEPLSTKLRC